MPDPFSDGWALAALSIIITVAGLALPTLRKVASPWRKKSEYLETEIEELKKEAIARTEMLTEARIENTLYKARLENCQEQIKNWESGRWKV